MLNAHLRDPIRSTRARSGREEDMIPGRRTGKIARRPSFPSWAAVSSLLPKHLNQATRTSIRSTTKQELRTARHRTKV
jgi:hypothetical protein